MGQDQIYYVATESVLRGRFGRILNWIAGPIPRKKGASALDTVRQCLTHIRAGHSVCLFAEGEQSWDGCNIPVAEGTGKLVRMAKATLVTYRLEGGYLSLPRWGEKLRRGRIRGRIAGIYPPEELHAMTPEAINELIDRDIRENAWERQQAEQVRYKGRNPAQYLERLLYLCPNCRRISTLKSTGDRLTCGCGLDLRYTETGSFAENSPFPTLADWDSWQKNELQEMFLTSPAQTVLFEDLPVILTKIHAQHQEEAAGEGSITQYKDRLDCAGQSFEMSEITDMAMVQHNKLLFTYRNAYYQIRSRAPRTNLRKYLDIWKQRS